MKVYLGLLGILEGDGKRVLEDYSFPSWLFAQRKNYDEYYIIDSFYNFEGLSLDVLQLLSQRFAVQVEHDSVTLSNFL